MSDDIRSKVDKALNWIEDNGSWGAKTKLAQLWDWFSHRSKKEVEVDNDISQLWEKVDSKLDKAECTVKHDKLVADIEKMLNEREKNWKYWVDQLFRLLPFFVLLGVYLTQAGVIVQ